MTRWYCERCQTPTVEMTVGEACLMLDYEIICPNCYSVHDCIQLINGLELEVERMEHEGEEVPDLVMDALNACRLRANELRMELREDEARWLR